ncbi:MAG TPA: mannosyltransferase family protein [Candidatus Saccharimonadales bacterium]|nr:mannosyltransferase family protein [Candidatus Saccharimonadales bacterium]
MYLKKFKTESVKIRQFLIKRGWLLAILMALFIVIIGVGFGLENNKIVPVNPVHFVHYNAAPHNRLSFLSNWDGPNYLNIAKDGYTNSDQTNFFPLYPIIIRGVNAVIGSLLTSALIISWVCLAGAIYFYLKIIKLYFKVNDNLEALKATLFFVLFPTGVFLLATYTESLFAFVSLGAIYYAMRRKYVLAGLLTMIATATHVNGVFLLVLIALLLIEARQKLSHVLISFIVGSLGLVSYMVFLWVRYHNPFEFVSAQKAHGWLQHGLLAQTSGLNLLNIAFALLILLAVIYWWKRSKSFSIYSLLYLLIPLAGGQFGGFPRYTLMVFPVEFMLYEYFRDKKFAYPLVIAVLGISWTYFLLQYTGGYIGG